MDRPLRVDTVPSVGPFSPQMSFKSVLLPAPLGPTSTMRDLGWMPKLMFLNR